MFEFQIFLCPVRVVANEHYWGPDRDSNFRIFTFLYLEYVSLTTRIFSKSIHYFQLLRITKHIKIKFRNQFDSSKIKHTLNLLPRFKVQLIFKIAITKVTKQCMLAITWN